MDNNKYQVDWDSIMKAADSYVVGFPSDVNKFIEKNLNDPPWYIQPSCRFCSNHPSNGGSGICHCILGSPTIY